MCLLIYFGSPVRVPKGGLHVFLCPFLCPSLCTFLSRLCLSFLALACWLRPEAQDWEAVVTVDSVTLLPVPGEVSISPYQA